MPKALSCALAADRKAIRAQMHAEEQRVVAQRRAEVEACYEQYKPTQVFRAEGMQEAQRESELIQVYGCWRELVTTQRGWMDTWEMGTWDKDTDDPCPGCVEVCGQCAS